MIKLISGGLPEQLLRIKKLPPGLTLQQGGPGVHGDRACQPLTWTSASVAQWSYIVAMMRSI